MTMNDDTPVARIQGDSFAALPSYVGGNPLGSTEEEEFEYSYDLTQIRIILTAPHAF
jgi:hypothetical protein